MITRKGYKRYQTIIQVKEISKILEKGELKGAITRSTEYYKRGRKN